MRIEAHAKINTVLDVTGKRSDGYHEVDMVLQELSLHDDVELTAECAAISPARIGADSSKAQPAVAVPLPQITVTVSDDAGLSVAGVPTDEKNIAVKAAIRFFEELFRLSERDADVSARVLSGKITVPEKLHIHLTKRIPAAAGLAGGSTDAAAVLRGLSELCGTDFPDEKLCEIGLKAGADVPYCILGGTMRAQGIGEKLTRLPDMPKVPVLLVKPAEGVSTKEIYEALDPLLIAGRAGIHPDVEKCISVFPRTDTEAGLRELADACGNILELVTAEKLPVIKEIEKQMLSEGALCTMMSGSGPTVFGLFADERTRDRAAERLAGYFGSNAEILKTETV